MKLLITVSFTNKHGKGSVNHIIGCSISVWTWYVDLCPDLRLHISNLQTATTKRDSSSRSTHHAIRTALLDRSAPGVRTAPVPMITHAQVTVQGVPRYWAPGTTEDPGVERSLSSAFPAWWMIPKDDVWRLSVLGKANTRQVGFLRETLSSWLVR